MPANYGNDGYIPLFSLKISNYPVNLGKNEEPDLPGKYKIKEILGKVLTWHLRVFNQKK